MGKAEAHGGYLCRLDGLDGRALPAIARESLAQDEEATEGTGLLVSVHKKVVRFAFDAPFTYGGGHRVGGETVRYEDAEIDDDEISEEAFEALRNRWPMAHLGRLLGLTREEILRLPYARSVLMPLDVDAGPGLERLWDEPVVPARH